MAHYPHTLLKQVVAERHLEHAHMNVADLTEGACNDLEMPLPRMGVESLHEFLAGLPNAWPPESPIDAASNIQRALEVGRRYEAIRHAIWDGVDWGLQRCSGRGASVTHEFEEMWPMADPRPEEGHDADMLS